MEFRQRFLLVRETSGLTDSELGEIFGKSRQTIHLWATGQQLPYGKLSVHKAELIAVALEMAIGKKLLPFHKSMTRDLRHDRLWSMRRKLLEAATI